MNKKRTALCGAALLLAVSTLIYAQNDTSQTDMSQNNMSQTTGTTTGLQPMSQDQITQTLQGNTMTSVSVSNLNGQLINNAFTGYFSQQGQMMGRFLNQPSGNQPQSDQGAWTVKQGNLCVTWKVWFQGQETCFAMYDLKNSYLFVNAADNSLGTVVVKSNIKSGNQMSNQFNQ